MKVPWLPKRQISRVAESVIAGYENKIGRNLTPPISVEEIIENYLHIRLGTMNFETHLGMKGVLGATYVGARVICIDESFSQTGLEGRYTFTCAHEVGHWVFHRQYAKEVNRNRPQELSIICHSERAREPIEWQADYFASCLLMPEEAVKATFARMCGSKPILLENVRGTILSSAFFIEPCVQNWPLIAGATIEAGGLKNASKQAMIIRLQDLGLTVNLTGVQMEWNRYQTAG
jgi:hypothetical protein